MKRSAGINASAVIGIIGSIVSILLGGLMVIAAVRTRFTPLPSALDQPVPLAAPALMLAIISIVYFGFGAWGIVSAVGLLRLKNWARICFAVFGGILALFSLFGAFGMLMTMFVLPPNIPPGSNVPPGLITSILVIFAVFMLLSASLGIWWVIYFNRGSLKVQFPGEAASSGSGQLPLGISIVAWFLIVGGGICGLLMFFSFPTLMFGFVLRGWAVRLVFLLYAVAGLGSGIGMLKKRIEALTVAVAYFIVGALNGISYFLIPGSFERMMALSREVYGIQAPPLNMTTAFMWSILFGLIVSTLPLWFLLARRKAFIEACRK